MESTAKVIQIQKVSNIIPFSFVVEEHKNNIEENITHCNKSSLSGKSCEVYAFRTKEEIQKMIEVLDQHIVNALDENKRQIAYRNKLLFVIGINDYLLTSQTGDKVLHILSSIVILLIVRRLNSRRNEILIIVISLCDLLGNIY